MTIGTNKTVRVGFVQLNNSFSNQYYLPLAVGMLQAYAIKHLEGVDRIIFKDPIYKFMDIDEAAEYLADCDLVGFSVYVWNEQNSLAIAQRYKEKNTKGVVVFGGPQVPNSHKRFSRFKNIDISIEAKQQERIHFTPNYHKAYPFIDMLCHGEGERAFTAILEQMLKDNCIDKSAIPSVSYVDQNGQFKFNQILPRMTDVELAQTPSPFSSSVFDSLMDGAPEQKWILMYETDRGCPYMCTYCDWGGATEDKISKFTLDQIYEDIKWIGKNKIPYVFLCNANFGILKRDVEIASYFAEIKREFGYLEGVSTQNAKNPKAHTIQALEVLEKAGLNKATVMSQQSLNEETLKAVRRDNMKLDEYQAIQNQLASDGVYTMTDLIFPMPGETYETIVNAVNTLIKQGQHNKIQFNNLSILRNTEMGNPEYQRKYGMTIIRSKIINSHGKKNELISGIEEYQELVVATNTMPREQWVRTRVFCWMVNLLYFNKLMQIPAITLNNNSHISYSDVIELFCSDYGHKYPVISEVYAYFLELAQQIQAGTQEEFVFSTESLNIYWPPEEYILIKLVREEKLDKFYSEATDLIKSQAKMELSEELIEDAFRLNKAMLKLPLVKDDIFLNLGHNLLDFYKSVTFGKTVELEKVATTIVIDRTSEQWDSFDIWCQNVVWYGNRRGAYLYGNVNKMQELEGHH